MTGLLSVKITEPHFSL